MGCFSYGVEFEFILLCVTSCHASFPHLGTFCYTSLKIWYTCGEKFIYTHHEHDHGILGLLESESEYLLIPEEIMYKYVTVSMPLTHPRTSLYCSLSMVEIFYSIHL